MPQFIYWPKFLAWLVTGFCAGISARSAAVFAKHQRRIYSILLLFALIWAMLLPYYSEQHPLDIILGFTGFLLWHLGHLISDQSGESRGRFRILIDNIAPWLFVGMVLPSTLTVLSAFGKFSTVGGDPWWLPTLGLATLISVIGYSSLYDAFRTYSRDKIGKIWLSVILACYGLGETGFTVKSYIVRYHNSGSDPCKAENNYFSTPFCGGMNEYSAVAFMILKAALTITFICLLLKRATLQMEVRVLNRWERVLMLFTGTYQLSDDHVKNLEEAAKRPGEEADAIGVLEKMAKDGSEKAKEALQLKNLEEAAERPDEEADAITVLEKMANDGSEKAKEVLQRLAKSSQRASDALKRLADSAKASSTGA